MTILIVILLVIVFFIIWLASKVSNTTKRESTFQDSDCSQQTTGNETYDFINEASGVELFEYEKERED
jgi:hypothetical protein